MNLINFFVRNIILAILIGFSSSYSFSQENTNHVKLAPNWEVGESKKIHVERTSKMSFDDSLVRNVRSSYDVIVKLIESNTDYTLLWMCRNDDEMLQFANHSETSDPIENKLIESLKIAEKAIILEDLTLQMNKETGEIKEWLNGIRILKKAEYNGKKEIKTWGASQDITPDLLVDLELDFSKKLNAAYDFWRTQLLRKANMFFESYDKSFVLNQTLTDQVMTKNIMDIEDENTEFPGTMTSDASEVNNRLILDKKIEYDKEFLTLYLRKIGNSFVDLSLSDVMIFEKEKTIFDLKTTWIINYSKTMYFEVRGMKTTTSNSITFLTIK